MKMGQHVSINFRTYLLYIIFKSVFVSRVNRYLIKFKKMLKYVSYLALVGRVFGVDYRNHGTDWKED
jgi:hypothetical protein